MSYLENISAGYTTADNILEINKLQSENQALTEELKQCQNDKEFVWSLWKRLQVASPNVTEAVALVIQREKEKAETKDRKVLNILQQKDFKIEELEKLITSYRNELNDVSPRVHKLQAENSELQAKILEVQTKLQTNELQGTSQKVRNLEIQIEELKKDKQNLESIKGSQSDRLQTIDRDYVTVRDNYEQISAELREAKLLLKKYENKLKTIDRHTSSKNKELEAVRKELSDLWSTHRQTLNQNSHQTDLINQLQSLQKDTQKVMKNQEEAFNLETDSVQNLYSNLKLKYKTLNQSNVDIKEKLAEVKKNLVNKDLIIDELKKRLDEPIKSVGTQAFVSASTDKCFQTIQPDSEKDHRITVLQLELETLKERLNNRERELARVENETRRSSGKSRRGRSLSSSPARQNLNSLTQGHGRSSNFTDQKLQATKELLRIKMEELEELKSAHDKRLNRLRSLQENYRLLRKQLKLSEEELNGPSKKKKQVPRASKKSLQNEDCDEVWNELTHFRKENKQLKTENMNLNEELDLLKVKLSQDSATIHELKTCVEQEREELVFLMEQQTARSSTPVPENDEELNKITAKLNSFGEQLQIVRKNNQRLQIDNDKLNDEKKKLLNKVNSLQLSEANFKIEQTNLKRNIMRLNRELKKCSLRKTQNNKKSSLTKKYQKMLNGSIKDMSEIFKDFNKDGWEDIGDSEVVNSQEDEITEGNSSSPTDTSVSLGQTIMQQAQKNATPPSPPTQCTNRQIESIKQHVERLAPLPDPVESHPVKRCSRASSPISFPSPNVISKKKFGLVSANSRQLSSLRQRIMCLQKHIIVLKNSKQNTSTSLNDYKRKLTLLESELSSSNIKIQSQKLTIQRLNNEIERLKLEQDLAEQEAELESLNASNDLHVRKEEADLINLQSRLRNSNSDCSKQLSQIKKLKNDLSVKDEKINHLQGRLCHLERDVAQKRILVDDIRLKLRLAEDSNSQDNVAMAKIETRLQNVLDANARYKAQAESNKNRLMAITREKRENESQVIKLTDEINKKNRTVSDLQKKNSELQVTIVELERLAQEQLHALGSQSETAIETAHTKVTKANERLQEYNKFTKGLAQSLVVSIQQARGFIRQQQEKQQQQQQQMSGVLTEETALNQAQKVACNILNISHAELESLMSEGENDVSKDFSAVPNKMSSEYQMDKAWQKKIDQILGKEVQFSDSLVEQFMLKIEEKEKLSREFSSL